MKLDCAEAPAVVITPMDGGNRGLYNSFPSEFDITDILWPFNEGGFYMYEFEKLAKPIAKTYPDTPYTEHQDEVVFFALLDGQCVGQIHAYRDWNGMALIWDIRVRRECRMRGIGCKLMDTVVAWAKENGFLALRLETQNNNAAACRFYSRYGFLLMGVDLAVYMATPYKGETALYWYYLLVPMEQWG